MSQNNKVYKREQIVAEQRKKELKYLEQEINQKKELLNKLNNQIYSKSQVLERINIINQQKERELDHAYRLVTYKNRQMELIADNSPIGIAYTDIFHCYTYMNSLYEELIGLPIHENLGESISTIWKPRTSEIIEEQLNRALKEGRFTTELFLTFPNNQERFIILTIAPEYDENELLGYFHFIEDITPLKEIEWTLRKNNDQLEEEVNERKIIEKELKIANNELRHFAYAVSHDMKAPAITISSFSQILLRKYRASFDEEGKELLHFISISSNRMNIMINDLLKYATMDRNLEASKDVVLNDVFLVVQSILQQSIKQTKTTIKVGILPIVKGHETLLIQLFQNIISNAIKFRKQDTEPIIHIAAHQVDHFHKISIQDNGIGIEEKNFSDIFGIFNRLHSKSEYKGSGIGLATCKKIIDFYQGKIEVKSIIGQGTTFHIYLPRIHE